jgi:hypothetical protein
MQSLPYPGYSWTLSQHTRKLVTDTRITFALLEAAARFGSLQNYDDVITEHILKLNLIPPNIRDERPQIWRDYQQGLLELGLIVPTHATKPVVVVTQIGMMWLDGLMGTEELLTTQSLRYQYPNGYKLDISPAVRKEIQAANTFSANSRVELDSHYSVLLKPGVLLLRALLELLNAGFTPEISSQECLIALLPTRSNRDWEQAFANLLLQRQTNQLYPPSPRELRHIQEWFALLGATGVFNETRGRLSLKPESISNADDLRILCEYHEDPASFWYPEPNGGRERWARSWAAHFGTPELQSQWVLDNKSPEYIAENYPDGVEALEENELLTDLQDWRASISPRPFAESIPQTNVVLTAQSVNVERILRGAQQRQESTRLHEYIVNLLARRLQSEGFTVQEDRQSVDVLATKDGIESILEVKTVTPNNIIQRMRLGTGQLSEYRYRRQIQQGNRPYGVLVLSSVASFPEWLPNFFQDDIQLGLLSLAKGDIFLAYTQGAVETILATASH